MSVNLSRTTEAPLSDTARVLDEKITELTAKNDQVLGRNELLKMTVVDLASKIEQLQAENAQLNERIAQMNDSKLKMTASPEMKLSQKQLEMSDKPAELTISQRLKTTPRVFIRSGLIRTVSPDQDLIVSKKEVAEVREENEILQDQLRVSQKLNDELQKQNQVSVALVLIVVTMAFCFGYLIGK